MKLSGTFRALIRLYACVGLTACVSAGKGAYRAMRAALKSAGLTSAQVPPPYLPDSTPPT